MMRSLFLFLICFSAIAKADFLIKKDGLKAMDVSSLGFERNITLSINVNLPEGQKVNMGASGYIRVFEKTGGEWFLVKDININNKILLPGQDLSFQEKVSFSSTDSQVAIDAIIYHCAINNKGSCYIDNFQKIVSRSGKHRSVDVLLRPSKAL